MVEFTMENIQVFGEQYSLDIYTRPSRMDCRVKPGNDE